MSFPPNGYHAVISLVTSINDGYSILLVKN